MKSILAKGLVALFCGTFIGCASIPGDAGFTDVQGLVGERVDYSLKWNKGTQPDQEVADAVDRLLAAELTPDAAV